jgi:peptide/nickel transport system ATP-binding protein
MGLMGAIPSLEGDTERLVQIPGSMPRLSAIPQGCAFNPRCAKVFARCHAERPELIRIGERQVACHLYDAGHIAQGDREIAA